jgi:uncharacterized protein (TIGR01777 family)
MQPAFYRFEHVQKELDCGSRGTYVLNMFKIVIAGGTGHLGTILARSFVSTRDEVVVLTRRATADAGSRNTTPARRVLWNARSGGQWEREIDGADVVINLAGRSVNCRYTAQHRREILESRVDSTRAVGDAIARAANPPHVWLQASTATIYAHRFDAPNDERTGILGGHEPYVPPSWHFSIDVARAWEGALDAAPTPRTRKVAMRTAIVMSTAPAQPFDIYHYLVRLGLGGRHGDGRQFVSWIHEFDFVAAVRWLIDHRYTSGAVNIAAPNPLPNADFMRELRAAAGRRFGMFASGPVLALAALVHRTETELLLKSRRVVPTRLLETGFRFAYPEWGAAARELVARARDGQRTRHQIAAAVS